MTRQKPKVVVIGPALGANAGLARRWAQTQFWLGYWGLRDIGIAGLRDFPQRIASTDGLAC